MYLPKCLRLLLQPWRMYAIAMVPSSSWTRRTAPTQCCGAATVRCAHAGLHVHAACQSGCTTDPA